MSAKIKKITLKLGDKEIELSVEEAKELKTILSDLFGGPIQQVIHEYPTWRHWYPQWSSTVCGCSSAKGTDDSGWITLTATNT